MCRWGVCREINTVYMCRFCGTRFCSACLRGDFPGAMYYPDLCRICKQQECRGRLVEKSPDTLVSGTPRTGRSTNTGSRSISSNFPGSPTPKNVPIATSSILSRVSSLSKSKKIINLITPPQLEDDVSRLDISYP